MSNSRRFLKHNGAAEMDFIVMDQLLFGKIKHLKWNKIVLTPEEDKKLFFIPNNIPAGIETADPMLNFRSKAYPISVKERQ